MNEDNNKLVKDWIRKGDHDLGTARITFLHIPEYLDTIVFHCQQAVEKYLKAILIHKSLSFRYTHDLVYLLELLLDSNPELNGYYDQIIILQSYAVEVRYPNETIFLSVDKIEHAIKLSRELRAFCISVTGIDIDYHRIIDMD